MLELNRNHFLCFSLFEGISFEKIHFYSQSSEIEVNFMIKYLKYLQIFVVRNSGLFSSRNIWMEAMDNFNLLFYKKMSVTMNFSAENIFSNLTKLSPTWFDLKSLKKDQTTLKEKYCKINAGFKNKKNILQNKFRLFKIKKYIL